MCICISDVPFRLTDKVTFAPEQQLRLGWATMTMIMVIIIIIGWCNQTAPLTESSFPGSFLFNMHIVQDVCGFHLLFSSSDSRSRQKAFSFLCFPFGVLSRLSRCFCRGLFYLSLSFSLYPLYIFFISASCAGNVTTDIKEDFCRRSELQRRWVREREKESRGPPTYIQASCMYELLLTQEPVGSQNACAWFEPAIPRLA